MTSFGMERLAFRLHDFTRYLWVSDHAKEVWQPRIDTIVQCWQEIAWRAVVADIQPCAVLLIAPEQVPLWESRMAEHHLVVLTLDSFPTRTPSYATIASVREEGELRHYRIVIASAANIERWQRAWEADDQREVRTLQGYPDCCRDFFLDAWIKERFLDTSWPMAVNTAARKEVSPTHYEVEGPPQCNILLRWLGVRAVPHLPCSFDCAATVQRAEQLLALGKEAGYTQELAWLQEMLEWPIEWSALHGIAEIKTPIVKIATLTDATPYKYVVRRRGQTYPAEGAHGLAFPYYQPVCLHLSHSRSFQRGLANPIEAIGDKS